MPYWLVGEKPLGTNGMALSTGENKTVLIPTGICLFINHEIGEMGQHIMIL